VQAMPHGKSQCRPGYTKYKAANFGSKVKGFTVYSVSLDKTKDNWLQAIKQDGLIWPNHVSDLKWWYGETTQRYDVQGIPTNWLINEKGIIVAKICMARHWKMPLKAS
jgi:hypothetical protein